ncbi:MAG: hypothetical protein R2738_02490 [Bacteroides graminisolvens]
MIIKAVVCKRVSRRVRIEEKRRVKYRRNKEKTSSAEEEKESSNSCFLGVTECASISISRFFAP